MKQERFGFIEAKQNRPGGRPRYFYYNLQLPPRDRRKVTHDRKGRPIISEGRLWEPKSHGSKPVVVERYNKKKKLVSYRRHGSHATIHDVEEQRFRRMYVPYDLPVIS